MTQIQHQPHAYLQHQQPQQQHPQLPAAPPVWLRPLNPPAAAPLSPADPIEIIDLDSPRNSIKDHTWGNANDKS